MDRIDAYVTLGIGPSSKSCIQLIVEEILPTLSEENLMDAVEVFRVWLAGQHG